MPSPGSGAQSVDGSRGVSSAIDFRSEFCNQSCLLSFTFNRMKFLTWSNANNKKARDGLGKDGSDSCIVKLLWAGAVQVRMMMPLERWRKKKEFIGAAVIVFIIRNFEMKQLHGFHLKSFVCMLQSVSWLISCVLVGCCIQCNNDFLLIVHCTTCERCHCGHAGYCLC